MELSAIPSCIRLDVQFPGQLRSTEILRIFPKVTQHLVTESMELIHLDWFIMGKSGSGLLPHIIQKPILWDPGRHVSGQSAFCVSIDP